MKTANEYRQIQVLSLKDEIEKLQGEIQGIRDERAEWESGKKHREEVLSGIEQQTIAAQESHDAKIRTFDAEIEQKEQRVKDLETRISNLETWHSHEAAEKSAEMIEVDMKIDAKRANLRTLKGEETAIKEKIAQSKTDEVSALRSTATALDENKKALKTLADTKERIAQAERDWQAGETARAESTKVLTDWEKRLNTREEDFNIIVERLKPEFVQVYGETKVNAHIFNPSRPKT